MEVAIAFFGNRIAIKENDGPIISTACGSDQFHLICDHYEKNRARITFCDNENEMDRIRPFDWGLDH